MNQKELYTLGIDIGSTTVKIAILDENNEVVFSDYERHFANIQETLSDLLGRAVHKLGPVHASPVITGSGGLTLAKHLGVPFVQEVIAVSTALHIEDEKYNADQGIAAGRKKYDVEQRVSEQIVIRLTQYILGDFVVNAVFGPVQIRSEMI